MAITPSLVSLVVVALGGIVAMSSLVLFAQKVSRWSLWKLRPATLLVLATLSAVTANLAQKAGDRGGTGNGEWRMENEEGSGPRSLPTELASVPNLIAIREFAVNHSNTTLVFEVACSNILFDYAASRNLYLFSSTNLAEPRWTPLGAFAMPLGTNLRTFTVTTNNVDASALPWFLDSLNGLGFYRFAADFDTDGDGLTDTHERLWSFTDPNMPDTDYDGISDADEMVAGTDPLVRDTDGDGLVDGSDPDPTVPTSLADLDGDDIPDAYETHWFGGTNAYNSADVRDATGFSIGAKILAGINPTLAVPSANVVAADSLVSVELFGAFAADWPADATNLVWERTFSIYRSTAWQQFFVSASPAAAAEWSLDGMVLEWDAGEGICGSVSASLYGDSFRIPLAADDRPYELTLRLRASCGASMVCSPSPLYLMAYVPEFRMVGGREITGHSGAKYRVFLDGSASQVGLSVDRSLRPCHEPPGSDESDMGWFDEMGFWDDDLTFYGDDAGGTIAVRRPGTFWISCPGLDFDAVSSRSARAGTRSGGDEMLVVLSPSVHWACAGHGCACDGLGYDWDEDAYYEEDTYPLDTACLRRKWYRDWGGGWYDGWCALEVSSGAGEDGVITVSSVGDTGKVFVDGVQVWSRAEEHVRSDALCATEYHENFLADECDSCETDCADGNCDALEGPSLGSLKFRIPLGAPVKGQVAGFVWFSSDGPISISKTTFSLMSHPEAFIEETAISGTRRIVCYDSRGRDLRIENIANGARITIYDTAAQTLEHTWEIVNVNGNPSQVRLRKISRLDNVMSDETYTYSDGDWTQFDNIADVGTHLETYGSFFGEFGGFTDETRTVTDANGIMLSSVYVGKNRVGEHDNAVSRETYRSEWTGLGWKVTQAVYWDDPSHSARHGQPHLVWGNARPWVYSDYDEDGHETLRVEQRGNSEMPTDIPRAAPDGPFDLSALENAFATIRDYTPLPGDSRDPDDAARPRIETRYVVTNGVATLIASTRMRYTRLVLNGYDAVKRETWRTGTTGVSPVDAYSCEITYTDTGYWTPLLMRNAVAESLDEDGVLTVNTYTFADEILTCETRRYGPNAGGVPSPVAAFPIYEVIERDASYGTILRKTVRLTDGDTIIADEQSIYDDQNRLRSTTYLDGTSLTNAYSCCRLLWKRDREGRKVLRSAQTGTDHLYNAMEDVWLDEVANGFRVTQHFYDALGRETNTVTYAGSTPGEATIPSQSSQLSQMSQTTTTYPYGGSDYAIRTDERGTTTLTRTDITDGRYTETTETISTNGVVALTTKRRSYLGGGSSLRREWVGQAAPCPPPSPDGPLPLAAVWSEERRFDEYDQSGRRIEYVVTESSDNGVVTNSVSTYDLLGRLVTVATPCTAPGGSPSSATAITSNSYDGASARILESIYTAGDIVRTTTYLYNDWGEQVGTVLDGVTNRTDTAYETDASNIVWRVVTSTVIGPSTNSLSITRTQLTGLSDACRRHTVVITGTTGVSPVVGAVTETIASFDPVTGIETETVTSSVAPTIVRRSLHGVLLSTETGDTTVSNFYDAFARVTVTSRQIGEGNFLPLQSFDYAAIGDLLAAHTYTNGDEVVSETYSYDMLGNRVSTTDAHGNTVYKTYDPLGNVVAEWGATYPVRYTYDTAGRRTSLTTFRDAGGSRPVATDGDTTTWSYDPRTSLCLSKTYADGSAVHYTYTPDNLPLRTTYASGSWKENVYDTQRRLTGVLYSSPDMDHAIQNDAYGNATNVQDAAGNIWRHVYGFNSKMLGEMFIQGDGVTGVQGATYFVAATNDIARDYDAFDRPTGYALAVNGETKGGVGYAYDADGRISRIIATNSADRSFSVAYTNVAGYNCGYTITTPNGSAIRRIVERDEFRRNLVTNCATCFNSSLVDSNAYTFDALARPTTRRTGTTGVSSVDAHFAYNNRSEVVSAAIGSNLYAHAYDDIGNHVLFSDNLTTNTFTHNALNQMVGRDAPIAPPTTFAYTPDGGLSSDGTWNYSYDAEDQLASITSSSLTNGAIRVLNAYDYRHRRISKTVQRLSVTTAPPPSPPVEIYEWNTIEYRTFAYDNWNLIHETATAIDGGTTNVAEIQYFWGLDLSDSLQDAGGVGGLLAVSSNGQFYFPTFDNNGNVTKYIDESGNVVAAYEYDDFGRIISQSGPLADFFRHRFSTKYFDAKTGLYYYGYRFYSPYWRIWLNRDPLEENGGPNLYGFCDNNPIVFVDTLGEHITITEDNLVVRDRISTKSRAVFIPMAHVSFSCSWNGVLHIEGKASRRIEILTPNMPSWNQRKRRYNDKWGKDRSNAKEWSAAYAHEMDHWNSFNALFAFLHLLNDFDGKNLCNKCNEMKDELERQYNTLWNSSLQHSERYDSDKYNYGGAYPKAR